MKTFSWMLFHLLISISYSIQRFCLCQPGRLLDSCSLEKKCHRYYSQSDIIIYNSQSSFSKNLFSNLNLSQKSIKDEHDIKYDNFNSILFEVFGSKAGSKKSNPISINMQDEMFSNISKLAIYGGESNQVIHIKNMNSVQISFEAQNMQVIFENDNQVNFGKLLLRNSYLKSKNYSSKLTVEAQEVIGDSASLSSNYFSLIKTGKIQVTDKKEQNLDLTNNFGITAPVKIINLDSPKSISIEKKAKKIQEDSSTPANRFANYFCLTTQARLSRAKELLECDAYSVPTQNYYSGRDPEFLDLLAHASDDAELRIYVTLSTEADPIRLNIPEFTNDRVTISFISADVDTETRMEVKGRSNSTIESISTKNSTLSVSKIDYFLIDSTYLQSYFTVQLYQSPIYISDARSNTTVQNLTTDATSISQFTGTDLIVQHNLYISRATPVTLLGKVFLAENCTVEVNQYSAFPITRYNYDKDAYYLTLSDAIEDQRLDLYFKSRIVMNYTENSAVSKAPSLTFAGGKTIRQNGDPSTIRADCPYINFTISVPDLGVILNYGSGSERETAFPHQSVFTFNNASASATDLNLTISDFATIGNNISDYPVLTFVGPFNINVMTPETISPYLQGVNCKFNNSDCNALYGGAPNEALPSFINASDIKCYQIGGYNLSLVNLDIQEKLKNVTYDGSAVLVGLTDSENLEKFPKIADAIEITSSTDGDVNFSINTKETPPEKITKLRLNLKGKPKIYFDESYNTTYNSTCPKYFEIVDVMKRLVIDHGSNDLLLIGETVPVPPIIIDDPVEGVLFQSDVKFPHETITQEILDDNTRYGPTIEVKIDKDINFPQEAFLAEEVIFKGSSTSTSTPTLHFQYINPSLVNYTFQDIGVDFTSPSKSVNFIGKRLAFKKAQLKPKDPLKINVDELYINSIDSILENSVTSPIIINKTLIIDLVLPSSSKILAEEEKVKQIIFGDDSVTLVDQNNKKSAQFQTSDPNVQTTITTNQPDQIQLSVEDGAETVPPNLNLDFTGDSANVNFDKSWSGVDIPETFVTDFSKVPDKKDIHLSTEMMSIPNVTIEGAEKRDINTSTHKRKLTKELAFWIFIGITALVFVVTLILCIVGLTCCKYVEQLDISSSGEGNSDIAIGEVDGLPFTQAEIEERERNKPLIKEERARLIQERKRKQQEEEEKKRKRMEEIKAKKEKRKKLIAEGKLEEEDVDDDNEEEDNLEDKYFNDDDDDMYHNRSQIFLASQNSKKKQNQPPKKKHTETSEEFDQAKKRAQLNTASDVAATPAAPPKAPQKQAESDDVDYGSYNQSDISEFTNSD